MARLDSLQSSAPSRWLLNNAMALDIACHPAIIDPKLERAERCYSGRVRADAKSPSGQEERGRGVKAPLQFRVGLREEIGARLH